MNPDVIKALTPGYLGTLGLLIAVLAVFAPSATTEFRFAILSLASSAIGAAGGIAQQSRQQNTSDNQEVNLDSRP